MVSYVLSFSVSIMVCHFTAKKCQHDPDDDSGMDPSTFSDAESTTFSEVSYYYLHQTVCITVCIEAQTRKKISVWIALIFENTWSTKHCNFVELFVSLCLTGSW